MTGGRATVGPHPGLHFQRILQDDAIRLAFVWLLLIALNTMTLLGLQLWWARTAGLESLSPRVLLALLWLAAAAYLSLGRQRERCRPLDLSLPFSARSLWLSHTVAVTLAAFGAVLLALVPIVAIGLLRGEAFGVHLPPELPGGVVHLLAAVLLAVTILQGHKPGLWRIPSDRHWWLRMALVNGGLLLWALAATSTPSWMALVIVTGAVVLAARTWSSLPSTLVLAPAKAVPRAAASDRQTTTRRWSSTHAIVSVLYRVEPWGALTTWVVLPLVALFGAVMAGWLEIWIDASELRFLYLPFAVYMQLSLVGPVSQNLHKLDPLPVSRRRLFALLVLPAMLALVLGYLAGRMDRRQRVPRVTQVEYRVEGQYHWVQPPPGYLEIAWDGVVPDLESPWGERREAWSAALAAWSPIRVFSRFNTAEEASADFEALLTSRAVEAVHGLKIAPAEIRQRYFLVEEDTVVGLREGGLALARDYPGLEPADSGPEAPIVLGTALVLYLLVLTLFLSTFRASVGDRVRQTVFWGFLVAILLLLFTQMGLAISGIFRPDAARILFEVAVRNLAANPLAPALAWVGGGIAVAAGYLLAMSRFDRAEFSPRPARFTLIDFRRDSDPLH